MLPKSLLRFSLRLTLVLLAVVCVALAYVRHRVREITQESRRASYLEQGGAFVTTELDESLIGRLLLSQDARRRVTEIYFNEDFQGDWNVLNGSTTLKILTIHSPVTERDLASLSRNVGLVYVDINSAEFTGVGLRHFASCKQLRQLSLSDCGITDDGVKELQQLKSVAILNLDGTKITDQAIELIASMPQLSGLHLDRTQATVGKVISTGIAPRLQSLTASRTKGNDSDVSALADSQNLRICDLQCTGIKVRALYEFQRSKSIRWLGVTITEPRELDAFKQAFGHIQFDNKTDCETGDSPDRALP